MFYSPNFSFNGIDNDMMDVVLVTTNKTDILNEIGTVYIENIKIQNERSDNPYYLIDGKSIEPIVLEFAYVDLNNDTPLA